MMTRHIPILNPSMLSYCVLIFFIFQTVHGQAGMPFYYTDQRPRYTAGKSVSNAPLGVGDGAYTITPELTPNLVIDPVTGVISGIPVGASQISYQILYKNGNVTRACFLTILVIDKPTDVTCGLSKMQISAPVSTVLYCTGSGVISQWALNYKDRRLHMYGNMLFFDNFMITSTTVLTITANNTAGEAITTIEVSLQTNIHYEVGIWVKLYDLNPTKCTDFDAKTQGYTMYQTFFPDVHDLTDWGSWRDNFYDAISRIVSINGTMNGFLDIKNEADYTFYLQTGLQMAAKVYIDEVNIMDNWDSCPGWQTTPTQADIKLKSGYHQILIEYKAGEGTDFKFQFQYSKKGEAASLIPFDYVNPEFIPVSYLTSDQTEYSLLNDAIAIIPLRLDSGTARLCKVTNGAKIPDGMEITTNGIEGNPQLNQEYTKYEINCENGYSTSNTITIQIRVVGKEKAAKGVLGYYIKVSRFDTSLKTQYSPSSDSTVTHFLRVDEFVSQDQSEGNTPVIPDGLNADFLTDYAVYQEGYIRPIEEDRKEGIWEFKLCASGGSWLYLNRKLLIANEGRRNFSDCGIASVGITDDFFFLQVYYVHHRGQNGMELYWKPFGDTDFSYVRSLYFMPTNDYFHLDCKVASYIVGDEKIDNDIYIHDENVWDPVTFSSNPALPKGLGFSPDLGQIGGDIEEQDESSQDYIITGKSAGGVEHSTTITITIVASVSPTAVYLKDRETGNESSTVNLVVGQFYDFELVVDKGSVTFFELSSIPSGFSYNPFTNFFSGAVRDEMSGTDITVIVHTAHTTQEFKVTLKATHGCEAPARMHTFRFSSSTTDVGQYISLTVSGYPDDFINYYEPQTTLPKLLYKCIEPGTMKLSVSSYGEKVALGVYVGGYLVYYAPDTTIVEVNIKTILSKPEFKYDTTNATLYVNNEILFVPLPLEQGDILFYTSGYSLGKGEKLPNGMHLSTRTGIISGTPVSLTNETTYNIIAENDFGLFTFTLIMRVVFDSQAWDCEREGNVLFGVVVKVTTEAERVGYFVSDQRGKTIINRPSGSFENNRTYTLKKCVEKGRYNTVLQDYSHYGWGTSTTIDLMVFNSHIGKYTMSYNDGGAKQIENDLYYSVYSETEWQYAAEPVANWEDPNTELTWPRSTIRNLPTNIFKNGKLCLKTILQEFAAEEMTGYFIELSKTSKVTVKVNNRLVFDNQEFDKTDTIYKLILPDDDLEKTTAIAVTIEKGDRDDITAPGNFRFFLMGLDGEKNQDECILTTNFDGFVKSSSSYATEGHDASQAFDIDDQSYWEEKYPDTSATSFVEFSFGKNTFASFSQFNVYAPNADYSNKPTQLKLKAAKTDKGEWIDIMEMNPPNYFHLPPYGVYHDTYNHDRNQIYSKVKIEIPKTQTNPSDPGLEVRELQFYICKNVSCPAESNRPQGLVNTRITVNCADNSTGSSLYYCSTGGNWIQITTTCQSLPVIDYQESQVFLNGGIDYFDFSCFRVSGMGIKYTWDCPIAELTLNPDTGSFSGKPYITGTYQVKFYAKNNIGTVEIKVEIAVTEPQGPVILSPPRNKTFNIGQKYENVELFKVYSTPGKPVEYSSKLPPGLTQDTKTGLISGTPLTIGSTDVLFSVMNIDDTTSQIIKIIIANSDVPTVIRVTEVTTLLKGQTYPKIAIVVCSASGLSYSISPPLPASLQYDTVTGEYSGTVTASKQDFANYVITCSANGHKVDTTVKISVSEGGGPIEESNQSPITIVAGTDLNQQYYKVSGAGLTHKTDKLPNKLSLATNGSIIGYGVQATRPTLYFITVSNNHGAITVTLNITVTMPEKPVVVESTKPNAPQVVNSVSYINIKFFEVVGNNLVYEVTPTLPSGLSLDPMTGAVFGIPANSQSTEYTFKVTSSITGDFVTQKVTIEFTIMKCPADDGFPATTVGETAIKKCGGGNTGFITRKCESEKNSVKWGPPIEECTASAGSVGPLVGIIFGCIIGGGLLFLGGYCIYARFGGSTKHVRKTAEQMVIDSKDNGVRI